MTAGGPSHANRRDTATPTATPTAHGVGNLLREGCGGRSGEELKRAREAQVGPQVGLGEQRLEQGHLLAAANHKRTWWRAVHPHRKFTPTVYSKVLAGVCYQPRPLVVAAGTPRARKQRPKPVPRNGRVAVHEHLPTARDAHGDAYTTEARAP